MVTISASSGSGLQQYNSMPSSAVSLLCTMCLVIDLFQAASAQAKWLICLFAITGVFSFIYWFISVPILFEFLKDRQETETWVQHWSMIYFAIALLLWCLLLFIMVGIWYLCRNRAFRNVEEPMKEALVTKDDYERKREAKEKARQTLGLNDDETRQLNKLFLQRTTSKESSKKERSGETVTPAQERSNSKIKYKKTVEHLELAETEITSLPEYSPQAKTSMFDFSEGSEENLERERSRSPFREFLHLVQIEPPTSPEQTFEEESLLRFSVPASLEEKEKQSTSSRRYSPTDSTNTGGPPLVSQDVKDREGRELPEYTVSASDDDDVFENEISHTLEEADQQVIGDVGTLSKPPHQDQVSLTSTDSEVIAERAQPGHERNSSSEKENEVTLQQEQEAKKECKPPPTLMRKGSTMFLGVIGKTQSVLSEVTFQISRDKDEVGEPDDGNVTIVSRRYQVLAASHS